MTKSCFLKLFITFFLFSAHSMIDHSSKNYSSQNLSLKDFYEMRQLVQELILQSKSHLSPDDPTIGVDETVEQLKASLKIVLMKPDRDHQSSSLILILQNEIMNYRSFDAVFTELVTEAVQEFQSSKRNPKKQISLLYVLENSIAHLKSNNTPESTQALQILKRGNLKISKTMTEHLLLNMGREKPISPSFVAKQVLKERLTAQKTEQRTAKQRKEKIKKQNTITFTRIKENETYRKKASVESVEEEKPSSFFKRISSWFKKEKAQPSDSSLEEQNTKDSNIIKIDL